MYEGHGYYAYEFPMWVLRRVIIIATSHLSSSIANALKIMSKAKECKVEVHQALM